MVQVHTIRTLLHISLPFCLCCGLQRRRLSNVDFVTEFRAAFLLVGFAQASLALTILDRTPMFQTSNPSTTHMSPPLPDNPCRMPLPCKPPHHACHACLGSHATSFAPACTTEIHSYPQPVCTPPTPQPPTQALPQYLFAPFSLETGRPDSAELTWPCRGFCPYCGLRPAAAAGELGAAPPADATSPITPPSSSRLSVSGLMPLWRRFMDALAVAPPAGRAPRELAPAGGGPRPPGRPRPAPRAAGLFLPRRSWPCSCECTQGVSVESASSIKCAAR